ncbi:MAG: hypothetical protein IKL05_04390 [Clostridia bacterium]|nr:hypothetical protein [Clostridia bacterium]
MKINRNRLEEAKPCHKLTVSNAKSVLLFVGLALLSWALLNGSLICEGWQRDLLMGLGTGAGTSALVSLVFYLNDKQIKKRESLNQRIAFMHEFRFLYWNVITSINFDKCNGVVLSLEDYVKRQHRWYHEYYKRTVAKSATEEETRLRIERLKEFIASSIARFQELFEYDSAWKNGDYTSWQKTELSGLYVEFKNVRIFLDCNDYESAILEFAYLLERIKRMASEFTELKSFELLRFEYDENGSLHIDVSLFEEKEVDFKFAREFNEIRRSNYIKHYSKDSIVK